MTPELLNILSEFSFNDSFINVRHSIKTFLVKIVFLSDSSCSNSIEMSVVITP